MDLVATCTAFDGEQRLAAGSRSDVAVAARLRLDDRPDAAVLIFDDATGQQIDFDLSGNRDAIVARLERASAVSEAREGARGRGRPRLGVVAREVTLLPRHWEWLAQQPGGASVALRKLVEAARRSGSVADERRSARDRTYHFMSAMAGNRAGFEAAARALFADDLATLTTLITGWPNDIREHILRLSGAAI